MKGSRSIARVSVASLAALFLSGCPTAGRGLFGSSVPIDTGDRTPPTATVFVAAEQLAPSTADLFVTTTERTANAARSSFTYAMVGEDPEGVRSVTLENLGVTPWCDELQVPGRATRPRAATAKIVLGDTAANTADGRASTRLPLIKTFGVTLHQPSDLCPPDRPVIYGAVVRIRGSALNYGSLAARTADAIIHIGSTTGGTGPVGGGTTTSPPTTPPTCADAGRPCPMPPIDACRARGSGFGVMGVYVCRGADVVCEARPGIDYCTSGGSAACGASEGSSCTTDADCAPTAVCARPSVAGAPAQCRGLLVPEPPSRRVPCTVPSGMCWLPSEVDDAGIRAIICPEGVAPP
jgi:hypothetical protein